MDGGVGGGPNDTILPSMVLTSRAKEAVETAEVLKLRSAGSLLTNRPWTINWSG